MTNDMHDGSPLTHTITTEIVNSGTSFTPFELVTRIDGRIVGTMTAQTIELLDDSRTLQARLAADSLARQGRLGHSVIGHFHGPIVP